MRVILMALLALSINLGTGCCRKPQAPEPTPPIAVRGWQDFEESGVHYVGEFLLNKGQSTENGQIGVSLVDVIPAKPCADEGYLSYPKAVIRFYRVPDQEVLCEATFLSGGGGTLLNSPSYCGNKLDLTGFFLMSVNTKEGWAYFALSNQKLLSK
jgi:hypothetical protein